MPIPGFFFPSTAAAAVSVAVFVVCAKHPQQGSNPSTKQLQLLHIPSIIFLSISQLTPTSTSNSDTSIDRPALSLLSSRLGQVPKAQLQFIETKSDVDYM
jgi:hypothetical protein